VSIRICICKHLQRHLRHHNSCATEVAYDNTLDVAPTPDCNFTSWNTRILANGARGAASRGAKQQCRQCCSPTVAQAPFPPPHVRTRFHKQKTEAEVGTRKELRNPCVCAAGKYVHPEEASTRMGEMPQNSSREQTFETRLHVLHHCSTASLFRLTVLAPEDQNPLEIIECR
jgi:hypothetical protein